jgi:serine protease Do
VIEIERITVLENQGAFRNDGTTKICDQDQNDPSHLLMRRIRTRAGIAAIGAGVLIAAGLTEMAAITSIAYAQSPPQWPGFADVVEKNKPAVISVRTRPDAGARAGKGRSPVPDETPLERFFRRFGQPDDDSAPAQVSRQASGFFILPDGYAVTNSPRR